MKSIANNRKFLIPLVLVTSLFFLWGIANSLNGTLIKHFQTALDLNRAQAGIIDSAFYIGYFIMALPAGFFIKKLGYKKGILIGLLLYATGAFLFYPAAEFRVYGFFLFALFVIACGLAFLETAANPYVTILGDQQSAEKRINLAQSFNGLSIILGPVIGGLFIFSKDEYTNASLNAMPIGQAKAIRVAEAHSVQIPYLIIGSVVLLVALLITLTKMPDIESSSDDRSSIKKIIHHKHLVKGIIAQFFYVGAQASLWGYYVDLKLHFAKAENISSVEWLYRMDSTMTATQMASFHASFALVLFMIGRFVGTWLLTIVESNKLLAFYSASCVGLMVIAWLSSGLTSLLAITITYFFMSIMFPTIFALSIRNLGSQLKLGSALVIMAIVGGAVLPPLAGLMSGYGMQHALIVPLISFIIIFYFGWRGYKPLTV